MTDKTTREPYLPARPRKRLHQETVLTTYRCVVTVIRKIDEEPEPVERGRRGRYGYGN